MNKRILAFVLLLVCILLPGCLPKREYNLEVVFTNVADKDVFEKRIEALDIYINDVEYDGTSYIYNLETVHIYEQSSFDVLCHNYVVKVLDSDKTEVLTREDVVSAKFARGTAELTVTESQGEYLYEIGFGRNTHALIDGVEFEGLSGLDLKHINELSFVHHKGCDECLQKIAIYFATDDIVGDIEVRLLDN